MEVAFHLLLLAFERSEGGRPLRERETKKEEEEEIEEVVNGKGEGEEGGRERGRGAER